VEQCGIFDYPHRLLKTSEQFQDKGAGNQVNRLARCTRWARKSSGIVEHRCNDGDITAYACLSTTTRANHAQLTNTTHSIQGMLQLHPQKCNIQQSHQLRVKKVSKQNRKAEENQPGNGFGETTSVRNGPWASSAAAKHLPQKETTSPSGGQRTLCALCAVTERTMPDEKKPLKPQRGKKNLKQEWEDAINPLFKKLS